MAQGSNASMRSSFEQRIGILNYVSEKEHGWHGQIRTRFTDFQVHEISKDGEVIHLHDFQTNARELAKAGTSRQSTAMPQASQASPTDNGKTAAEDVSTVSETPKEPQPDNVEQKKNEDTSTIISLSDRTILTEILGQGTAEELINLHEKSSQNKGVRPKNSDFVKIAAITDKAQRSRVHTEVRRIFGGKLDTATESDGSIKATVVSRGNLQWGNRSRNDRSRNNGQDPGQANEGKFLHFTLYKENRDTMEAINQIGRVLNLKPSFFGTAGTKDRRAVTTQRVSMRRRNPQTLISINNERVFGVKIGDFKFEHYPIHLGQHKGNEFVIVAKNCYFSGTKDLAFEQKLNIAKTTIDSALAQVKENGFINYYGTQRFGTHQIGTQEIGMKILKQDFEGAVRALLSFDPQLLETSEPDSMASMRREDAARALACSIFSNTGDAQEALKILPRRCHVESALMRQLGKHPKDFLGALLSINRGMRSMYVHAYQSLVWNFAASKRWERFGPCVVKGDLIFVESEASVSQNAHQNGNDDEEMIHLVDGGSINEETHGLKVHALTEQEAASGKYSIFDIVLPSPGWDVMYPDNEIGQFYNEFMAKEENGGLDPQDMLRQQRDFSLPGSYRKLMGKFIDTPSASVQAYSNDMEQLVPTDLDIIRSRKVKEEGERAAARREMKTSSSAWQNFVDNVQEIDLQTTNEKRKAEDSSHVPESRVEDTWVQTSVDENNKRVKVSVQHDTFSAGMQKENNASTTAGDEMQVDVDAADQVDKVEVPQTMNPDNGDSVHSVVPESGPEGHASNAVIAVPVEEAAQPIEKKIAVILRFALNTSQYATIVLRELQGVVPTSEDAVSLPSSSAPLSEGAIDIL